MKKRADKKDTKIDESYTLFTNQLKRAIKPFQGEKEDRLKLLDSQIVNVFRLERHFVNLLELSSKKQAIAMLFLKYLEEKGKVVTAARPFFRERNLVYVKYLLPELRRHCWSAVYRYATNWPFLLWVITHIVLGVNYNRIVAKVELPEYKPTIELEPELLERLVEVVLELKKLRDDIVVQNLPLAIDRARMFARCTPRAELTDLDLIGHATEGLLIGIDKVMIEAKPMPHWAPSFHPVANVAYWRGESANLPGEPFAFPEWVVSGYRVENHHTSNKHKTTVKRPECPASVFRTTAIGKMGARLINSYSTTHLHLGPLDKRLLYHSNKRAAAHTSPEGHDYKEIANHIRRDRIAWYIARDYKIDIKVAEKEVNTLYKSVVDGSMFNWSSTGRGVELPDNIDEDVWDVLGILLASKYEDADEIVFLSRSCADELSVAAIMKASSVVPTIDDEGEDKQDRTHSYSAPTEEQPESKYEENQGLRLLRKALATLSIIERKVLVLSGLAELNCLEG